MYTRKQDISEKGEIMQEYYKKWTELMKEKEIKSLQLGNGRANIGLKDKVQSFPFGDTTKLYTALKRDAIKRGCIKTSHICKYIVEIDGKTCLSVILIDQIVVKSKDNMIMLAIF